MNKYIIENGQLSISASVDSHWHLAKNHKDKANIRGGWWMYREKEHKLYFYSSSLDYGAPTLSEFQKAANDNIFCFLSFDEAPENLKIVFSLNEKLDEILNDEPNVFVK